MANQNGAPNGGANSQAVVVKPVFDLLGKDDGFKRQVALALPAIGITPERMLRVVLTECRRTPKLFECTKASMMEAVMMCAETGLLPGRMGFASIIPYAKEATFQLGYKGVVQLIWRHDRVIGVRAECVYEADDFADRLDGVPHWVPSKLPVADRGAITDVFACIAVSGGGVVVKAWPYADVLAHRDRYSKAWKKYGMSSTWGTHPEIMACKTMLIQASKWAPLTTEAANAIAGDERGDIIGAGAELDADTIAADLEGAAKSALDDIDASLQRPDEGAPPGPGARTAEPDPDAGGGVGAGAEPAQPVSTPPPPTGAPSTLQAEEIADLDRGQLLSIIDERAKGLGLVDAVAKVRRYISAQYEVRNIGGVDEGGLRWVVSNWSTLTEDWQRQADEEMGAAAEANAEPDPEHASQDAEADAANGNGKLPGVS